jgi:hypothetical protein
MHTEQQTTTSTGRPEIITEKIGSCEYKDIAADCYKRNAPNLGIV